ncbi:DEAD/DEAH box helicase [Pendulispora brunnea]|uniref:DEAD/DEAH box helicase n=1 Tax=Pendulispora brunnea TaxID=2905690 RepID=A0ABZ2KK34_9BACT
MTFSLYDFQRELVEQVQERFAAGTRAVLLQSPTGSGKTRTASELLRRETAAGQRSLFLAHLDTLIEDTFERVTAAGVHAGFVQAGRPLDPGAPVQVGSLATLHVRGERPPADFVVVDEAHRAGASTVRAILEAYPEARMLGLSATPQRSDGRPLNVFQEFIAGPAITWLTERGYLVPCDLLSPGEYQERGLWRDPVEFYLEEARGQRALVFAANIAHAVFLRERFANAGVRAACLTGTTPRAARHDIRDRMYAGDLNVIIGVSVFLEGWDLPAAEVAILARPFESCMAYLQAIGRVLRVSPATGKKSCLVGDLKGCVNIHGLPDELRIWLPFGEGDAVRRVDVQTQLRRCEKCFRVFRPSAHCPRCGAPAKHAPKLPLILNKAEKMELYSRFDRAERDMRYFMQLVRIAHRNMRVSQTGAERWALAQFQKRWGRLPEVHRAGE